MDIVGGRKFVEVPGERLLELPPLLIHDGGHPKKLDRVMDLAAKVVEREDMVPAHTLDAVAAPEEVERRKMDMAINLVDNYFGVLRHWHWGDGILEWIRQCETTFEHTDALKRLLRPDIWPHAGRSSFVRLLEDKEVQTGGVDLERAVGLRLAFRQPPPMHCMSDQFLFYLNGTLGNAAYQTWEQMSPAPLSELPPERFTFQVVKM
ncbi:MAG: hypothetical protein FJW39_32060 [Acidobacteria bacterium]|nr:hypothetical protein [Acidobacteriota bacterium]